MNLQETGAPLRILGGGAVLWLGISLLATRLQDVAMMYVDELESISRL
jgi:flagellar biosynthesis protein FliR